VRVKIMGSQKCRNVGKSQSVLVMINPIIFTRHAWARAQGKESWASVMTGSGGGEWRLANPAVKAATVERVRRVLLPAESDDGDSHTAAAGDGRRTLGQRRPLEAAVTSGDDDTRALVLCCLARASNVLAECTAECVVRVRMLAGDMTGSPVCAFAFLVLIRLTLDGVYRMRRDARSGCVCCSWRMFCGGRAIMERGWKRHGEYCARLCESSWPLSMHSTSENTHQVCTPSAHHPHRSARRRFSAVKSGCRRLFVIDWEHRSDSLRCRCSCCCEVNSL
jgi:hypothetical protein